MNQKLLRLRSVVAVSEIKSGEVFKRQPGTHARAIQEFYDIILPHIARADGTLLMVNHVRSRIEVRMQAAKPQPPLHPRRRH